MSEYDHRHHVPDPDGRSGGTPGIAPGKRSLTQSLAPVQRSLRDQQREVVGLDAAAGSDVYDERATVEAKVDEVPLTEPQLARAQRKNPRWVRKLKVSPQIFSTATVESAAFALDVAAKQVSAGLTVDGIAGPKTVAAIGGQVAAARSLHASPPGGRNSGPRAIDVDTGVGDGFYDQRATVDAVVDDDLDDEDRFANDDPFGMHLLGAS